MTSLGTRCGRSSLCFFSASLCVLCGGSFDEVSMPAFSAANPKLRFQLTFEGSWPTAVAFLGSGRKIAASNQLGQIFIWNLPDAPPALDPKTDGKERQAP